MQIEVPTVMTVVVPILGAVIWLVRLEGRINMNERLTNDLKDDIEEIKGDVKKLLQRSLTQRATDH